MINLPPGLPPWLKVLPPGLTQTYTAIQQAINDFMSGILPATQAPPEPPKPGFTPLPPGMGTTVEGGPQTQPRFPIPGFTPDEPSPIILADPEAEKSPQMPGFTPMPEFTRIRKAESEFLEEEDPLRSLEGEWRDPRSLPYPYPKSFMDLKGGVHDPQWNEPAGTRPYDKYQDRISRIMDSEFRYHTGFNPYFDTEGEPWSEPVPGDPTQVLTPGTAQWREKQALDRRDALIKQAHGIHQRWGVDLRELMRNVEAETEIKRGIERGVGGSLEQRFVDRWAQAPSTEMTEVVNDQWEEAIEQAEIKARKDADDESMFVDGGGAKSIDYLEDRYPNVNFEDLRIRDEDHELYDKMLPDKLRGLSRYVDEHYKNGGNFQEDFRELSRRAEATGAYDSGLDEFKAAGASPFQTSGTIMYHDELEALLPDDARIGEHGQIIPGETPIDQVVLDFHDEIMGEINEFS